MKYALRTQLGQDIIAEFMPQARPTKRERVIILCDGMPTVPGKRSVLEFFSRKGYWAFLPRYRGSWESGGEFLKESPDRDITVVIDQINRGFQDAWSGTIHRFKNPEIILIGSSFGGAVALLASRDTRVSKVITFSPLVDWTARSDEEPLEFLARFVENGFGQAYRGSGSIWAKLKVGDFFNPVRHINEIDGSKVFIIHATDDRSIRWRPVAQFAKKSGAQFLLLKHGGHLGLATATKPRFWKRIQKFITLK